MREPIEKYFCVGTIQWMSHPVRNVVESIRDFASDDFFSALEIRHFEDSAQREDARQLLARSHMWVGYRVRCAADAFCGGVESQCSGGERARSRRKSIDRSRGPSGFSGGFRYCISRGKMNGGTARNGLCSSVENHAQRV